MTSAKKYKRRLSASTHLSPAPTSRDTGVLESLILTGLTVIGVSGAALNFLVPALTALAVTGISVGLNFILNKPPKPEDGHVPVNQAIPPRVYAFGEARVAGAYMLIEEKKGDLYQVVALCAHRIHEIVRVYFNDDYVKATTGSVTGAAGAKVTDTNIGDGRLKNALIYGIRLGANPETAYEFITSALSAEGVWTSTHRGDGQASIGIKCLRQKQDRQLKRFPNGVPVPSAVVRGAFCWDFRDPAQDPEDESTWTWTRNPAIIIAWHLCFNTFGSLRNYERAILPVIDIWREEADICDENIPAASGGFVKRYTCDGFATTEYDSKVALNAMLNSCDGWMCERGDGSVILRVGKFREELVTDIYDGDIAGYSIQGEPNEEEATNRLNVRFTYPATDYVTAETDPFVDEQQQALDGRELPITMDLNYVTEWRTARRLGKREWKRLQMRRRGTLDLLLCGINAAYSRWIRVNSTLRVPRLNGSIVENKRMVIALIAGGFQCEFIEHPSDIDDWDPGADEGSAPPVPVRPTSDDPVAPTIDSILALSSGGSVFLRVIIADIDRDDATLLVRYRDADTGSGSPGSWVTSTYKTWTVDSGLIALDTGVVPADDTLEVAVGIQLAGGTEEWSLEEEVVSTVDLTAPDVATLTSATPSTGQVEIVFVTPNSANYVGQAIRRNTTNTEPSGPAVHVEYGSASSPDSWTDTGLAAGDYYYWLRSVNGSGVESAAVATGTVTVP